MRKPITAALRWLIALAMPVFIVLLWLRIVWNPWFINWEYGKADFPPDTYGFTIEQRVDYALQWIDYYNSTESPEAGVARFSALTLPGSDEPLYTPYEVSHMVDVRILTDTLWRILPFAALIVVGGLAVLLGVRRTRPDGYAAIFMGGLLSTGLLVATILFVLLSWRTFFVTLHDVFFEPGSWTFDWSSSLIRIFPDRFWFDAGIVLVGGALAISIVVMAAGWFLGRRGRTLHNRSE